jgi:putative membrane protein
VTATIAVVLIVLVAVEHLYFLYLEMFAWTDERTRKSFGTTLEFAQASKALAANQGLYNGFLAVGLLHTVAGPFKNLHLAVLFLSFVIVAALFGGATVNRRIFLIQGLPAIAAMVAVFLAL